jgi:hypothetical protein
MFNNNYNLDDILINHKQEVMDELNNNIPFGAYQKFINILSARNYENKKYITSLTILHKFKLGSENSENVYQTYVSINHRYSKNIIDIVKGICVKESFFNIEVGYNEFLFGIHNSGDIKKELVKTAWYYRKKVKINGKFLKVPEFKSYLRPLMKKSF